MSAKSTFWRNWWFSALLAPLYLGAFHLWVAVQHRPFWLASGTAITLVAALLFVLACRRGYFLNWADGFVHAAIIGDILIEAWLIDQHDHYGFYGCALGFGLVLIAYRTYLLRRCQARDNEPPPLPSETSRPPSQLHARPEPDTG